MVELAIISLGSNKGDWKVLFKSAISKLNCVGEVDSLSSVYETEPWGVKNQPWFKNQVIGLKTKLSPNHLLEIMLKIESENGRDRLKETKWGIRTLDLDLLFYGQIKMESSDLTIPHPLLHERKFILEPLVETYPNLIHPVLNKTSKKLIEDCTDKTEVKKIINVI